MSPDLRPLARYRGRVYLVTRERFDRWVAQEIDPRRAEVKAEIVCESAAKARRACRRLLILRRQLFFPGF